MSEGENTFIYLFYLATLSVAQSIYVVEQCDIKK